jgi:hypothetical protein
LEAQARRRIGKSDSLDFQDGFRQGIEEVLVTLTEIATRTENGSPMEGWAVDGLAVELPGPMPPPPMQRAADEAVAMNKPHAAEPERK